jgi:hypothetical protein
MAETEKDLGFQKKRLEPEKTEHKQSKQWPKIMPLKHIEQLLKPELAIQSQSLNASKTSWLRTMPLRNSEQLLKAELAI